ncbi:MAG TPA: ATP-binding protein [Verrucomicrobiae bacterium]|nr:ATP-binding protein [Verrucomicrobiae bacterium]
MWATIAILAVVAAIVMQWSWSRRFRALQKHTEEQQREIHRLRDQEELSSERAEAQRQALFNSMAEGFLLLDRHGRIQTVNQTLRDFFGIDSEVRGKTIVEAFRSHELVELWEQVQRESHVQRFELDLAGKNARSFEVSGAILPGRFGGIDGGVFIFHDMTRIKQLENTRREFVANVSHELRTPLTLIKGFVETLLDGAKDDPELSERFLQTIDKHTDRLTFLIEDLLTISQLESGQIVLNQQPVRLREVVERVFEDLQSRAAERKITLNNEAPETIEALADADRLQQVLFNLADNAIKYGRAEGGVWVTAEAREDGMIEMCVRDNGPGIPQESVERVFERFYRVDKARSREQGGTGLGLAIVKHIIQSHRGEVWLKSEVGVGSAFYFTLPAAD